MRWGIVGTGRVARLFAADLAHAAGARVVAVASRSAARARAFADEAGLPGARAHEGAAALAADPEVEIAYVASINTAHLADALACIAGGKAVLCEKPLALNAREAGLLVDAARRRGVFLMEGLWTRFFPAVRAAMDLLRSGGIGTPRAVTADLCYPAPFDPANRLFDPAQGGGALLDVGIYPLALAFDVLGDRPERVESVANLAPTGVDRTCSVAMRYGDGAMAAFTAGFEAQGRREAAVLGTRGRLVVHEPMWRPSRVTVEPAGGEARTIESPQPGRGYQHEAAEVMRLVAAGATECPFVPHAETLRRMELMDGLRARWGVRYPGE
ncbi:MAG: Gfo/Idh/MocA family oxidoreductase [Lentisphaerae bacterium]|nr:Gfo/Idh/MocA family oxidoreductase [Lentisphaerota bacterium]